MYDDDTAKIAAANLLDNYREQWNDNFIRNTEASQKLDKFIFNLRTGNLEDTGLIIQALSEAIMLTPANQRANSKLAYAVNSYIRHISRRKPKPRLTILYLRYCQQMYINSISSNFVHQSQLVSMVLISVFSNINIISNKTLIPKAVRDQLEEFKNARDDEFDIYNEEDDEE